MTDCLAVRQECVDCLYLLSLLLQSRSKSRQTDKVLKNLSGLQFAFVCVNSVGLCIKGRFP